MHRSCSHRCSHSSHTRPSSRHCSSSILTGTPGCTCHCYSWWCCKGRLGTWHRRRHSCCYPCLCQFRSHPSSHHCSSSSLSCTQGCTCRCCRWWCCKDKLGTWRRKRHSCWCPLLHWSHTHPSNHRCSSSSLGGTLGCTSHCCKRSCCEGSLGT
jgi:hypothetical protein